MAKYLKDSGNEADNIHQFLRSEKIEIGFIYFFSFPISGYYMKLESIPKPSMCTHIYINHSLKSGILLILDKLKEKTIIITKRIKDTITRSNCSDRRDHLFLQGKY